MAAKNGLGGPLLAAKIGLGGPLLAAKIGLGWDHFWQGGTTFGCQKWSPGTSFGNQKWSGGTSFGCQKWSGGPLLGGTTFGMTGNSRLGDRVGCGSSPHLLLHARPVPGAPEQR